MEKIIKLATSDGEPLRHLIPLATDVGELLTVATLRVAAAALLADSENNSPTPVATLQAAAADLLADSEKVLFSLRYTDSDGDEVTIAHDTDVKELANYMADEKMDMLTVIVTPQESTAGRRTANAVQTQLRSLVSAMSKLTTAKPKKATPANAMNLLVASLQTMDVAEESEELASVKKELLMVLQDDEFKNAVEFLSASDEFKELANAMAAAIYAENVEAIEETATARFNELLEFAKRIVDRCSSLKPVMIHVAKSCISGLVRFNDEQLADDESDLSSSSSSSSSSSCSDQQTVNGDDVAVDRPVHLNIICDGCEIAPLVGVRYKSLEVSDFDLCEECEASGKWVSHEPFIKITDPSRAPKPKCTPELVHPFVVCDGCGMSPIVGLRFTSKTAEDFDLCEACEGSGKWTQSHGPFNKIQEAGMMHALEFAGRRGGKRSHQGQHGKFGRPGNNRPPSVPFHEPPTHHHGIFNFTTPPLNSEGPPGFPGCSPPPPFEAASCFSSQGPPPSHGAPHGYRGPNDEGKPSFFGHDRPGCYGHPGHGPPPPPRDFNGRWNHHGLPRFPGCFGSSPHGNRGPSGPPPCPPGFPLEFDPLACRGFRRKHERRVRHPWSQEDKVEQQEEETRHHGCPGSGRWGRNASDLKARFLEDVTIEDGTVIESGKPLRKMWKLVNNGDRSWPAGCYMITQPGNPLFSGNRELSRIDLPPLASGEEFIAGVDLVAPEEPGRYTSFWRVCDPAHVSFGHRFWIDVVVVDNSTSDVTPSEAGTTESAEDLKKVEDTVSVEHSDAASDDDIEIIEAAEVQEAEVAGQAKAISDVEDVGPEEKVNYEEALMLLASMGFSDVSKNTLALELADGNVVGAVSALLSE